MPHIKSFLNPTSMTQLRSLSLPTPWRLLLASNHSTQLIARELRQILPDEVIREADYDSILPSLLSTEMPASTFGS